MTVNCFGSFCCLVCGNCEILLSFDTPYQRTTLIQFQSNARAEHNSSEFHIGVGMC